MLPREAEIPSRLNRSRYYAWENMATLRRCHSHFGGWHLIERQDAPLRWQMMRTTNFALENAWHSRNFFDVAQLTLRFVLDVGSEKTKDNGAN